MRRLLSAIAVLIIALPLSASYITAAVGNELYIIDDKTGDTIWRIEDGKRYPVKDGSTEDEDFPVLSVTGNLSKYDLDYDLKAKFTDSSIYVHFEISKGEKAMDPVIDEMIDSTSFFYLSCYDKDGFLLTKEKITLDGVTKLVDDYDNPTGLYVDKEFNGSADIRKLADYIRCTYSISGDITPAVLLLNIPYWLTGSWSSNYDTFKFTGNDLIYNDESIRTEAAEWMRNGEEDIIHDLLTAESYEIVLDTDSIKFTKTDNPDLILVNDVGDEYFILRDGAELTLEPFDEIPEWLIGDWEILGEDEAISFTDNDMLTEIYSAYGPYSLKEGFSYYYLDSAGKATISDSLSADTYSIAFEDESETGNLSFTKSSIDDFVIVNALSVYDGDFVTESALLVRPGSISKATLDEIPEWLKGTWTDNKAMTNIIVEDRDILDNAASLLDKAISDFIAHGGSTVITDSINEDGSYSVVTEQIERVFSETNDPNVIELKTVINGVESPSCFLVKEGTVPDFGKLDEIPEWLIGSWYNPEIEVSFNGGDAFINGESAAGLLRNSFYNNAQLAELDDQIEDDGSYTISAGNYKYTFSSTDNPALMKATDTSGTSYLFAKEGMENTLSFLDEIPLWLIGEWECKASEWDFAITENDFSDTETPSWNGKALDEYLTTGTADLSDSYLRGSYTIVTPEKKIMFSRTGSPDNLMVAVTEDGNTTYMEAIRK